MMAYATNLELGVVEQVKWAMDVFGVSSCFEWKKSPWVATYKPTGGKIIFRGLDKAEKAKGLKAPVGKYFTLMWIDEASLLANYSEIRNVQLTLARSQPKGVKMQVHLSTNPPRSFNNWVNVFTRQNRPDMLVTHTSYLDLPKDWVSDTFSREAEFVKSTNQIEYEYTFLGKPVKNEGAVFPNIDFSSFTKEELHSFKKTNIGLDFGVSLDPTAITLTHFDTDRKELHVFGERTFHSGDPDVIIRYLKELDEEFPFVNIMERRNLYGDGDGVGNPIILMMKKAGVGVVKADKGPNSVESRYGWMRTFSKIVIDNVKCPHSAEEFTNYTFKPCKDGSFVETYPDKDNHNIDSVAYSLSEQWTEARGRNHTVFKGKSLSFGRC